MPAGSVNNAAPTSPTGQRSDTETGAESGQDRGLTTGGETENEGVGADGKKNKPKKVKSFKNPFSSKNKNK